jgi:hypothetical protein
VTATTTGVNILDTLDVSGDVSLNILDSDIGVSVNAALNLNTDNLDITVSAATTGLEILSDLTVSGIVNLDISGANVGITANAVVNLNTEETTITVSANDLGVEILNELNVAGILNVNIDADVGLTVSTPLSLDADVSVSVTATTSGIQLLSDLNVSGTVTLDVERVLNTVDGVGVQIDGDITVDGGDLTISALVNVDATVLDLVGVRLNSNLNVLNGGVVSINGEVSPGLDGILGVVLNNIDATVGSTVTINSDLVDLDLATSVDVDRSLSILGDLLSADEDSSIVINISTMQLGAVLLETSLDLLNVELNVAIQREDSLSVLDSLLDNTEVSLQLEDSELNIFVIAPDINLNNVVGDLVVLDSDINLSLVNSIVNLDVDASLFLNTDVIESVIDLVDSTINVNVEASVDSTVALNDANLSIDSSDINVSINCDSGTCIGVNLDSILANGVVSINSEITGVCPLGACIGVNANANSNVNSGDLGLDLDLELSINGTAPQADVCDDCVGIDLEDVNLNAETSISLVGVGTTGVDLGVSVLNTPILVLSGASRIGTSSILSGDSGIGLNLGRASISASTVQALGSSQADLDISMNQLSLDFSNVLDVNNCGIAFIADATTGMNTISVSINEDSSIFGSCTVGFSGFPASVASSLNIDAGVVNFDAGVGIGGGDINVTGDLNLEGGLCGILSANSINIDLASIAACESRSKNLRSNLVLNTNTASIRSLDGNTNLDTELEVNSNVLNVANTRLSGNVAINTIALNISSIVDTSLTKNELPSRIQADADIDIESPNDLINVDSNVGLELLSDNGVVRLHSNIDGSDLDLSLGGGSSVDAGVNLNLRDLQLLNGIHDILGNVQGNVHLRSNLAVLRGLSSGTSASIDSVLVEESGSTIAPISGVLDLLTGEGSLHLGDLVLDNDVRLDFALDNHINYPHLILDTLTRNNIDARIAVDVSNFNGRPGDNFFLLSSSADLESAGLVDINGNPLQEYSVIRGPNGEDLVVSFRIHTDGSVSAKNHNGMLSVHENSVPFAVADSCFVDCDEGRACSCCVNVLDNDFDEDALDSLTPSLAGVPSSIRSRVTVSNDGNICYNRPASASTTENEDISISYRVTDSAGGNSVPAPVMFRLQPRTSNPPLGVSATRTPSSTRPPSSSSTPNPSQSSAANPSQSPAANPSPSSSSNPNPSSSPNPSQSSAANPSASRSSFVNPSPAASRSPVFINSDPIGPAPAPRPIVSPTPFVASDISDDTPYISFSQPDDDDESLVFAQPDDDDDSDSGAAQIAVSLLAIAAFLVAL